jgi:hypothetical protein
MNAPTSSDDIPYFAAFGCSVLRLHSICAGARPDEGHRAGEDDAERQGAKDA